MMGIIGKGVCMCLYMYTHCKGGNFYLINIIIKFLK